MNPHDFDSGKEVVGNMEDVLKKRCRVRVLGQSCSQILRAAGGPRVRTGDDKAFLFQDHLTVSKAQKDFPLLSM